VTAVGALSPGASEDVEADPGAPDGVEEPHATASNMLAIANPRTLCRIDALLRLMSFALPDRWVAMARACLLQPFKPVRVIPSMNLRWATK
jgi:hypothetical protein